MPLMEICVDCLSSAINAESGGASRIELCSNLVEGGTTPSIGTLKIVKQVVHLPIFAMLRPRGGDFCFSDSEFEMMKCDLELFKQYGADGIVTGILNTDGSIDIGRTQELIDMAQPLPVTFHRAIDLTTDLSRSLEIVIALGCTRVLTSGGESTALEGTPVIKKLIEQADGRVVVMPGGGVTERNMRRILDETGARELHASARVAQPSRMTYDNPAVSLALIGGVSVSSRERVRRMVSIVKSGAM